MGDPNLEQTQRLEGFKMEIKGIIDRSSDASLVRVKDVSDLQKEDMENWEKFKTVFKEFKDLINKKGDVNLVEVKIVLIGLVDLGKSFKNAVKADSGVNKNREFFYSWLNNRTYTLLNMSQLILDEPNNDEIRQMALRNIDEEVQKMRLS